MLRTGPMGCHIQHEPCAVGRPHGTESSTCTVAHRPWSRASTCCTQCTGWTWCCKCYIQYRACFACGALPGWFCMLGPGAQSGLALEPMSRVSLAKVQHVAHTLDQALDLHHVHSARFSLCTRLALHATYRVSLRHELDHTAP